jgi:hypothetical protein
MFELSNSTKKHTSKSRETIPLNKHSKIYWTIFGVTLDDINFAFFLTLYGIHALIY